MQHTRYACTTCALLLTDYTWLRDCNILGEKLPSRVADLVFVQANVADEFVQQADKFNKSRQLDRQEWLVWCNVHLRYVRYTRHTRYIRYTGRSGSSASCGWRWRGTARTSRTPPRASSAF